MDGSMDGWNCNKDRKRLEVRLTGLTVYDLAAWWSLDRGFMVLRADHDEWQLEPDSCTPVSTPVIKRMHKEGGTGQGGGHTERKHPTMQRWWA